MPTEFDPSGPRSDTFRIITVCTMNICRSPAMEVVLADTADTWLPGGITLDVSSAGTNATPGAPSCEIAQAHVGHNSRDQNARQIDEAVIDGADLILTAERRHANAVVTLAPRYSKVTFPLLAASRLARWLVTSGSLDVAVRKAQGELIERDYEKLETLVDPLPAGDMARLRWLVVQLNESRGLAPNPADRGLPYGVDDIPDPHVLGYNLHEMSAEMIKEALGDLGAVMQEVVAR
jgi:protein-tyrosine-phosphatase